MKESIETLEHDLEELEIEAQKCMELQSNIWAKLYDLRERITEIKNKKRKKK